MKVILLSGLSYFVLVFTVAFVLSILRVLLLVQVMGYLATWSATRLYIKDIGDDPLPALQSQLAVHWESPTQAHRVQWPLHLKVGHKP